LVTDENGDVLAESNNILNTWKNDFSVILNVYRISDVTQTEILIAESQASPFEVETLVVKLKRLPGTAQILAKLPEVRDETIRSEIHKHINYIWNKVELPGLWEEQALIAPIYKGDKTDCINY
jgi:hypothetical protein